ncbi:alpha/beta hydrolase [Humitalea sp. 24SJ18S-53]|uniref:alpha/beta hydrolase n=1 Tax=Humitalea sp. 24SJ18S-53 TaxID=3422307 RepID=UPI003D66ACD4
MPTLDGPRWGPKEGAAEHLVLLLHGVGADGNDLIDLAPGWAAAAPKARFWSPHAPAPYDMGGGGFGRQWFSLADRSPAMMAAGLAAIAPVIDAAIAEECAAMGIPETHVALFGFSQGAMTALSCGLRRAIPPAAILAYSGALRDAGTLATTIRARPPVLLVHGEDDEVVPAAASRAAEAALRAAGVPVEAMFCPRLGHGIDQAGISRGGLFLQRAFALLDAAEA